MRLSAKVLPVVRIHTLSLVVVLVLERTPFSLEVEHIELGVSHELMDQSNLDVYLRVSK